MNRARLGMILALVGAIGGSIGWLCWVPYQPERMLHAIPRNAVAVTVHRNLAGRQAVLLANPVTRFAIAPSAEGDGDPEALLANPAVQTNLRRFGSGELVAAYVPQMGPLAMDAYLFTSWLGGRSHGLRWFMLMAGSDMRRELLPGGRGYWITDTDVQDTRGRPLRFSLAFEEGLAIGCLSADPHNIRMALACYDRNLPSILTAEPRLQDWLMDAEEADRGWARIPGLLPIRYAVMDLEPNRLRAGLRCEGDWAEAAPGAMLALPAMFGPLPFASSTASRGLLAGLAGGGGWMGNLLKLVDGLGASGIGVSMFGGEYGGRLRGIRTPAAVLAVPCDDPPAATALMYRLVHRIGLQEGVDLAVVPTPGEEPRIYTLATVGKSFYGDLPAGERAAFCASDGWLLVASNRVTLERLLERRDWAAQAAAEGGAAGDALWLNLDLVRGEKSLRNALAMYSLVQVLEGGGNPEFMNHLGRVRTLLEEIAVLGRLELRAQPADNELVFELEVGQ